MSGAKDFWGPLAAGSFLILVGVLELLKYRGFRDRAERVTGTVVDMRHGLTLKHGYLYYPVIEFMTRSGRRIRTASRVGSKPAQAKVGEQVTIAYDPQNPEAAEIAGQGGVRIAVLVLVVLAGIFFIVLAWM